MSEQKKPFATRSKCKHVLSDLSPFALFPHDDGIIANRLIFFPDGHTECRPVRDSELVWC